MKYRKKPVVIDAIQYTGEPGPILDFLTEADCEKVSFSPSPRAIDRRIRIQTHEGEHTATPGDWIIRGVKGELYPCKPDIFSLTYDPID